MALERIYTIPLRKEFSKAPNYKRTKKAVKAAREFIQKHMKCQEVKIGRYLNLELWKHGRKNPPPKIQVKAVKDTIKIKDKEIEVVNVELPNAPVEKVEEEKKEEEKYKIKLPKFSKKKSEEETQKKEALKEPDQKKQIVESKQKQITKEQDKLQKTKKVIAKPEKPHHEKKK